MVIEINNKNYQSIKHNIIKFENTSTPASTNIIPVKICTFKTENEININKNLKWIALIQPITTSITKIRTQKRKKRKNYKKTKSTKQTLTVFKIRKVIKNGT